MNAMLVKTVFQSRDQALFAEFSGDFNPLHLDPVEARRAYFGAVAVHGVHFLLRALDALVSELSGPATSRLALTRLRGSFPNPTFLDTPATAECVELDDGHARVTGRCDGSLALQFEVAWEWVDTTGPDDPPDHAPSDAAREPIDRDIADVPGLSGRQALWLPAAAAERFPHLWNQVSKQTLAELLALTRLVGMECPGLRSIFSGFDLHFDPHGSRSSDLDWSVTRVLAKASFIKLDVSTGTLAGTLDTFLRPAAQAQASFADAQARVAQRSLASQRAVVVGGSRGLGEATAKLIAAGGGDVVVTYQKGRADAERVADEIRVGGGRCEALACDVEDPGAFADALRARGLNPTHLYYFASPKIFVKRGGAYRPELFEGFKRVYADGFEALCRICVAAAKGPVRAFYPSTTALDENVKNLEEYVDAKQAGELMCRTLCDEIAELDIVLRRLPRIATDQTTTLKPFPAADAVETMCDLVTEMNGTNHG